MKKKNCLKNINYRDQFYIKSCKKDIWIYQPRLKMKTRNKLIVQKYVQKYLVSAVHLKKAQIVKKKTHKYYLDELTYKDHIIIFLNSLKSLKIS